MSTFAQKRVNYPRDGPETSGSAHKDIFNEGAEGVPFFSPKQPVPAGTAIADQGATIPRIFQPVQVRGTRFQNRIWVSPMCQYSAQEGFATPWHLAHLGGILQRGPGLVMVEASSVQARGRITPEDLGIWLDAHVDGHRQIVQFAHSQNAKIGIQIAHAGRKASTVAPWLSTGDTATHAANGWPDDVIGPSDEPFDPRYPTPRAASIAEIEQVKRDFVAAARRAVDAGYDVIDLHFAHGYLVSSFLTPAVNKRTDKYGGSFENRTRLGLELVDAVRAVIPKDMPLYARISASDWLDTNPDWKGESWTIDEAAKFAELMVEHGVDVIDVSSGGNHSQQKVKGGPAYQAGFARAIKKAVGDKALVSAVGSINNGKLAEETIQGSGDEPKLDFIAAARPFQKNPGLVWAWADELGVPIVNAAQIRWGYGGRAK
jgi:2,4-dienoyl-CoA reductase-like NADH-dependent reductase (Old Yellow Enzyme family)